MDTWPSNTIPSWAWSRISRRTFVGSGLASAALLGVKPFVGAANWAPRPRSTAGRHRWLLESASDRRPAQPPAPTAAEADELLAMQAERTGARREAIARWGSRPAILPWTDLLLELITAARPSPRAAQALALTHVAMADAMAAVWDARAAFQRPSPAASIAGLTSLAQDGEWSFPSAHAAVAGAAATVMRELFPAVANRLADAEQEATLSRLWAGANYRGDVDAGLALGRAIGRLAIAWGKADGADATWDDAIPTGDDLWQPTPPKHQPKPLEPLAGRWVPWVLPSGDALRPPAPPAWGSPAWQAELLAVQEAVARRSPEQEEAVHFWAGGPGTVTPAGLWVEIARDLIVRDELDALAAAQVLALASVAMADAFVCCWDAKYAYWTARPITADPALKVLIATPPFPSYTSGHSTVSATAATV
jgi:membrane-associated phospholipid phosphatase